jgi:hypothetical protein
LCKNQHIIPSQTPNVQLILQWKIYRTPKMGHQLIGSTPIWNGTSLDQHTFLQCKFDTYIIQLGGIILQKVNQILKAIDFNNQLSNKMQSKTWIIYEAYKTSKCFVLDDAQGVHNRQVTWEDGAHHWLKCVQSWENIAHAYGLPKTLILC